MRCWYLHHREHNFSINLGSHKSREDAKTYLLSLDLSDTHGYRMDAEEVRQELETKEIYISCNNWG